MRPFLAGLALGILVLCAGYALASRNSSGTMAAINGPFVSGTVISSSAINARLADVETEITDSLDRSGKGGMLAPLRTTDGTAPAPSHSFTSETGSGLYRVGTGDLGLAVSGSKVVDWTASGEAISVASTGGIVPGSWFMPSLADANFAALLVGKSTGTALSGQLTYTKAATVANSTMCMGTWGLPGTLCVDGNAKTYIGATGTGISQINTGVGTFNAAAVATFTASVASGAKCIATHVGVGGAALVVEVSVTATTLTVTSSVPNDGGTANWMCF